MVENRKDLLVLLVIYNQQFQGTIILMVFDLQGMYIYFFLYINIYQHKMMVWKNVSPFKLCLFSGYINVKFQGGHKVGPY